jgi:hypothetical protein
MTLEQVKLSTDEVKETIKIIRILNLMLSSDKISEEEKKKIAQFFSGMVDQ